MIDLKRAVIVLVLSALPSAAFAEVINGIAAVVNDEPITVYQVRREAELLKREMGGKGEENDARLQSRALDQLIDKKLGEQKIRELDIKVSDEEINMAIEDVRKQNHLSHEALVAALRAQGLTFEQYRAQMREQLEKLRLMGQEVRSKIQVGEREVREYYDKNPGRFSEEAFQARHIFFAITEKTPPADAKRIMATAMEVLQEARDGKDFAALASKYSEDTLTAKEGGFLGSFKKGEMLPAIENSVSGMNPGEVSDLVVTPAGIHIIKLESRTSRPAKRFEEAKGEIEELLYRKKSEERFDQWVSDLRKNAAIERRM